MIVFVMHSRYQLKLHYLGTWASEKFTYPDAILRLIHAQILFLTEGQKCESPDERQNTLVVNDDHVKYPVTASFQNVQ